MAPNTRCSGFPIRHFVHNYTHAHSITKGRIRKFYLSSEQRYLFSRLELYARYDRRVMCPNTNRNHASIRDFVHTYTRTSKTSPPMRTFHILNDCSHIGDIYIYFVLELDGRYESQDMPPNTHRSLFSLSHLCIAKKFGHIGTVCSWINLLTSWLKKLCCGYINYGRL